MIYICIIVLLIVYSLLKLDLTQASKLYTQPGIVLTSAVLAG